MDHSDGGISNKHLLIMLLCCLIPIIAFVAVSFLGVPLSTLAYFALFLLCPLGHFFMMRRMGREGGHQHAAEDTDQH
jgi:uncharacterized membrane protein